MDKSTRQAHQVITPNRQVHSKDEGKRRKLTMYDYVAYLCAILLILLFVFMYYMRAVG